jgi:hypothetical protein
MSALGHDLRQARRSGSHMLTAGRQGHQPRATAQGTFRTQQGGAGKTSIAPNQQQVAELTLVGIAKSPIQMWQMARSQQLNVR